MISITPRVFFSEESFVSALTYPRESTSSIFSTVRGFASFRAPESRAPESINLESGSVESGLVLIPTTIFFLLILQLIVAGSWQVLERARLHDFVIKSIMASESGEEMAYSVIEEVRDGKGKSGSVPLTESSNLQINEEVAPIGLIREYDLTSPIPILGSIGEAVLGRDFRVHNFLVSISE